MQKVRSIVIAASLLLGCGGGGTEPHQDPAPPPARSKVSIEVAASRGIDGSPRSGTYLVDSGSTFAYRFSTRSGFERLAVTLGNAAAASEGQFQVTTPLTLIATADTILLPTPLGAELGAMLKKAVKEGGAASTQAFTELLDSALAAGEPERVLRELARAQAINLDPLADAARIVELELKRGDSQGGHAAAVRRTTRPGIAAAPAVRVFYVNGINTLTGEADATTSYLRLALFKEGLGEPTVAVEASHNLSAREDPAITLAAQAWVCLSLMAAQASNGLFSTSRKWQECFRQVPGMNASLDLEEAAGQIIRILIGNDPDAAIPDARRLAGLVEGALAEHAKVIVIAHSQGNLLMSQALAILRGKQTPLDCVGAISLAPPINPRTGSVPWGGVFARGSHLEIRDILLWFGGHGAVELATQTTAYWDDVVNAGWYANPLTVGVALHAVTHYVTDATTKAWLLGQVKSQLAGMSGSCGQANVASVVVRPATLTLAPGDSAQLQAIPLDDRGQPLEGESASWSSDAPATVAVSATGRLYALKLGGPTRVVATVRGKLGSALVTVDARRVARVDVTLGVGTLAPGAGTQAVAVARDTNGEVVLGVVPTWSSSNPAVASVNSVGEVTGIAEGTATIRAVVQSVAGEASVQVERVRGPLLSLDPATVNFSAVYGGPSPAAASVAIRNAGGGILNGISLGSISYGTGASGWLSAELKGAEAPTTIALQVASGTLAPGSYSAQLPVRAAAGVDGAPQSVTVNLSVTAATGSLVVSVTGLPPNGAAQVRYQGPDGILRTLTATSGSPTTIGNLRPGAYDVVPVDATVVTSFGHATYRAQVQRTTVEAGQVAKVELAYTLASAFLRFTVSGLPADCYGSVGYEGSSGAGGSGPIAPGDVGLGGAVGAPGTVTVKFGAPQGACSATSFHPEDPNRVIQVVPSLDPVEVHAHYVP